MGVCSLLRGTLGVQNLKQFENLPLNGQSCNLTQGVTQHKEWLHLACVVLLPLQLFTLSKCSVWLHNPFRSRFGKDGVCCRAKLWGRLWRNSVKYQRCQPLGAYCVERTVSDKDRTHTENTTGVWTHHECEFSSPSRSYANKRRKPRFPVISKWREGRADPLSIQTRRWFMTGEVCVVKLIRQVAALLIFLSGASRVRDEKQRGHPTTIWCLMTPQFTTLGSSDDAQKNSKHLTFK